MLQGTYLARDTALTSICQVDARVQGNGRKRGGLLQRFKDEKRAAKELEAAGGAASGRDARLKPAANGVKVRVAVKQETSARRRRVS